MVRGACAAQAACGQCGLQHGMRRAAEESRGPKARGAVMGGGACAAQAACGQPVASAAEDGQRRVLHVLLAAGKESPGGADMCLCAHAPWHSLACRVPPCVLCVRHPCCCPLQGRMRASCGCGLPPVPPRTLEAPACCVPHCMLAHGAACVWRGLHMARRAHGAPLLLCPLQGRMRASWTWTTSCAP